MGNLETPPSVRKLRTALHAKAKAEPEYRFYGPNYLQYPGVNASRDRIDVFISRWYSFSVAI